MRHKVLQHLVTLLAKLPRLIDAQSRQLSPLKHQVLIHPGTRLPRRLRLRTFDLVAYTLSNYLFIRTPLRKAELQLRLTLLQYSLLEDPVRRHVCAKATLRSATTCSANRSSHRR